MKKILLLSTNKAVTPYPVPPLGLALLYNRLQGSYDVRFLDGLNLSEKELDEHLRDFRPDYVGFSIRNIDDMVKDDVRTFLPEILEKFIVPVRKYRNIRVILGGSGFTIFPQELMDYFDADYGIVGEAEEIILRLLHTLDVGGDASDLEGVLVRGKAYVNRNREIGDFSRYYHADLDLLLDYEPYSQRGAYPVQTKRGCSHRCIYCSYPVLEGRRFRTRPVEEVVDEIEATANRIGSRELVFEFVDSTFNDPPGHGEALCREIIRRGLQLNFRTMGMNPVNINPELLLLMKKAGFTQIDATPDTASRMMLTHLKKNFTFEQLEQAAICIREADMPTMWFFIFGGPGETEETIKETFGFIDEYVYENDMVHVTEGMRIYPHTHLAEIAVREKTIKKGESLLFPNFYVSPELGEEKLSWVISEMLASRPNCIRLTETKPPPELLRAAIAERKKKRLTEPMFRTLLRLKQEMSGCSGSA